MARGDSLSSRSCLQPDQGPPPGRRMRGDAVTVLDAMNPLSLILEMKKLLGHTLAWIDKAEAHAAGRKYELDTLLDARLAPDMFPLARQFQSVCDSAKFAAAFTAGKVHPAPPTTEKPFGELRTRITSVIEYLGTFTEADFANTDARE